MSALPSNPHAQNPTTLSLHHQLQKYPVFMGMGEHVTFSPPFQDANLRLQCSMTRHVREAGTSSTQCKISVEHCQNLHRS